MDESDTTDDTDEAMATGITRRRFARSTAIVAGTLSLPGLAAAHHDNRSEQGEQNSNDDGAHENGNGNGRGRSSDDDDPGNSDEHRRDDEHRSEDDDDDDDENEGDDNDDEDEGEDGDDGNDDGGNEDGGGGGGDGDAQVTARRDDDGSVFFLPSGPGTDTNQVDIIVKQASQPVFIRDQFPSDWTVKTDPTDPHTTYTQEGRRFVKFTNRVESGDTRTYFADIPNNTGADEFGPIEYSLGGETWTEIPGTTEINTVATQPSV